MERLRETVEFRRLLEADSGGAPWRSWGPYLSERQWGTVREDYSHDGEAWDYLPHDHARSRAYRWGEDGIGGLSDEQQRLCLALALWNGRDPILKERMFGLSNGEGNHGEDVKELYYYLDASPSASYLKMLYKYPQAAYPYAELIARNRLDRRGRHEREFELIDTGVFDEDRYFDVCIEYAKASADDLLLRVTAVNRGPEAATLHVLPHLWFRNTWSWTEQAYRPGLRLEGGAVRADHRDLAACRFYVEGAAEWLFTENESNAARLWNAPDTGAYAKDAFHRYIVDGDSDAVNPLHTGTKCAARCTLEVPAGGTMTVRARLAAAGHPAPFDGFDAVFAERIAETDAFYRALQEHQACGEACMIQRQALAGMVWSKQFYYYDVRRWLAGDDASRLKPAPGRGDKRNGAWDHLNNADILSMPDTWEYPWFAAWDLAFHCIPLALIDPEFAKRQLVLLTREWYMHPNGQMPAYEWNFSDANPPVHAWAAWRVYQMDRKHRGGKGDRAFLESVFHKLLINFTWWVNRKDDGGRNVFQGGFLGLDNIGVFDRSKPLPTGGFLDQADGTSWMAMYCLNLMRIALELAQENPVYEDIATKFFEHFLHIAEAMNHIGHGDIGLWNETDGFFYDVLRRPNDAADALEIRSMVGLIPLFAVETLEPELLARVPEFARRMQWFLDYRPDLAQLVSRWHEPGAGERRLLALLRGHRMKCVLRRMLDEGEFFSPYGVRALSRVHCDRPYVFEHGGQRYDVAYVPGDSDSGLFGGNSNWRGPVWFPVNYLIIESLQKFHHYYGDGFTIECPTGSGQFVTILDVAQELSRRLADIFRRGPGGRRPVFGDCAKLQEDPHFRDHLLFHEYFHGDDGSGVGASHQTGWTGLIAKLLQPRREEWTPPGP